MCERGTCHQTVGTNRPLRLSVPLVRCDHILHSSNSGQPSGGGEGSGLKWGRGQRACVGASLLAASLFPFPSQAPPQAHPRTALSPLPGPLRAGRTEADATGRQVTALPGPAPGRPAPGGAPSAQIPARGAAR